MAKQSTTTKSAKRYRYSSFKDKIDDLKIEPAKNLSKRAHDYVESSHFLSSFEHWKEFNMSADFTEFAQEVVNLVQTLPQILYHDDKIYDILSKHIGKHDDKSLQPLLELLSQFCHDLGPDFLKFYERTLLLLINLLDESIKFENSDVFEWGFNCLAYIFKYLSRQLTQDLIPTFTMLFPLLSHKKEYMSRFAAEALSFLIRKSSPKNLLPFVHNSCKTLNQLENNNLYDGLHSLFSEALKSTSDTLYSKSNAIVSVLLQVALDKDQSLVAVTLFCDIMMDALRHASAENAAPLYQLIIEKLDEFLSQKQEGDDLDKVIKILAVVTFAESGKKVNNWEALSSCLQGALHHPRSESISPETLAFCFSVILRNADLKTVTSLHRTMFEFYMENYPSFFLEFVKTVIDMDKGRFSSFNCSRFIGQFIKSHWKEHQKKIALLLLDLESKPELSSTLNFTIPEEFVTSLTSDLQSLDALAAEDNIFELYWRNIILKRCDTDNTAVIVPNLKTLLEFPKPNDFVKDLIGDLLMGLSLSSQDTLQPICLQIAENFELYRDSTLFIQGYTRVIQSEGLDAHETREQLLHKITDNFILPDRNLRYHSMMLLIKILEKSGQDVPQLFRDLLIIDDIPLTLTNGRDITLRVRKLGADYSITEGTPLLNNGFFKYIFGLLTVRFSPLWDGINEILPNIYGKAQRLVWDLVLHLINALDNPHTLQYIEAPVSEPFAESFWTVSTTRLNDVLQSASDVFNMYVALDTSLIDTFKGRRGSLGYPGMIRNQALKILIALPQLAEQNSRFIVPFVLKRNDQFDANQDEDHLGELAVHSADTWSETDRNLILKLLGKFKNIKAIYKSEDVRQRLMELLGSRTLEVQKLALDALLAYKDPVAVKYRDNLKNLLDDTLFNDEVTKLFAQNESRVIVNTDERLLMPFILRILFGRVQTPNTSGIKKTRKTAVITVLPNLGEKNITDFLALGSNGINYQYFFEENAVIPDSELTAINFRRMLGFINVLSASLNVLGSNFPEAVKTTIKPLVYAIHMSGRTGQNKELQGSIDSLTASVRQQGMKCLFQLFGCIGEVIDWDEYLPIIHDHVIQPRVANFEHENLQSPSSIMKLICYWSTSKSFYPFLYYADYSAARALMALFSNEHAKESVLHVLLDCFTKIIKQPTTEDSYIDLASLVAATSLQVLPSLLLRLVEPDGISLAIDLLLNITEAGYVQDNDTTKLLVEALTSAVEKDLNGIKPADKVKVFACLSALLSSYVCQWNDLERLYVACSKMYRTLRDRKQRESLNTVFSSMGKRFEHIQPVAKLLCDLNSYSTSRMQEYDFETILSAFKVFTEETYQQFNEQHWLPILYTCLYFINDKEELALRTNSTHALTKFIDYANENPSAEQATAAISLIKDVLLPNLKLGLRSASDEIQAEYITLLAYIVTNSRYFTDFEDMKVLLFNNDEEANFFINIRHIQLHRRQRAIKRLGEASDKLNENSISHYLLPMIERYIFVEDEKYRNLCNETIATIGILSNYSSWNQYKAILRRYISMMKQKPNHLKEIVNVIVAVTRSFKNTLECIRSSNSSIPCIRNFPSKADEPNAYVENEIYPILHKILSTRDDETIIQRIPLAHSLINLVLGLPNERIVSLLPGILTSLCQVLRSRSEELRDVVRKNLGNIAVVLGPEYLTFVIQELKSALARGSQIHILSYSLHHVLVSMSEALGHGDLDDCASMIIDIVMEDTFGAAGQEKDAEGYTSKIKEVKFNKSYDTSELLAANINLPVFGTLLRPVKALLLERIGIKTQRKLDEVLRRYSLGLGHNSQASSPDVLKMCHEIYTLSQVFSPGSAKQRKEYNEKEDFFLIRLDAKRVDVQVECSHYIETLQKLSLDLLRVAISRNRNLLDTTYLEGFIPILKESLLSDNDGVVISTLKVLMLFIKLQFSEDSEAIFKNCARKVLTIIKDSPSTSGELCQVGLKFLSALIRYKDIELKDSALEYVLGRIEPDLMEPNKQGLAFGFLKSLVSKHIVLPKLYDIIDNVAEVMVTNHAKEIRDVARSVYYQFFMEYDQSKGRLEKQLKFLVNNLQYPSQEGRQSVMELLNLLINKSGPALLMKLSSSFFVFLANVSVNDDSPKCRKMASLLLTNLFKNLGQENMGTIEKYIQAWLKQVDNVLFVSLGMKIYKIYLLELGLGCNASLDGVALARIKAVLSDTEVGSDSLWDMVYTALETFAVFAQKSGDEVYSPAYKPTWDSIVACLLYPHEWVRLSASRLINVLLANMERLEVPLSDYEIQTIAYRTFHLLAAPSSSANVGSKEVSVKVLVNIAQYWNKHSTPYISKNNEDEVRYSTAMEFAISRISAILRNEENKSESHASKMSAIQLLAMLIQILDAAQLAQYGEAIILAVYTYVENNSGIDISEQFAELQQMSQEALNMLEEKLSTSDFTRAYTAAKQVVIKRRQERRAKRAQLAVTAPAIAAEKKLKKHARSREKRKHEKDENGFYQRKNKKKRTI
ncbi:AEL006Wp [Eremothecium gossypii ATCC 10895]|uniref:AEL006Wp n=1 Tax=Eremothecium gossypii (strain ATCC 10895 / CBS 109.51 / FGSC 9923 / NRRL Y-1056) TaxID=284811 RepID=Q757M8_EREGS|nr:AEL006Wp [Eremothecium gossypii ATCC 10895]AAS52679.2 AEL006Wp [Eremothecium gossypii ATCC 10895]AEY96984.1 FAEL006Wp [Eremothecium gossypii FDAG1]